MGKLHIVSQSDSPFTDRREAGQLLAAELAEMARQNPIVLGIPRGGLVVAREIACMLSADLDVALSRKLRAPDNPELAIGALSENGAVYLNQALLGQLDIGADYIEEEKRLQVADIEQRRRLIRRVLPRVPLAGRTVIITDDGIATGATMQAALWAVRQEAPRYIAAALPVGPEETVRRLAADCDRLVCLRTPPGFSAVGQFYIRFEQVADPEMLHILEEAMERRRHRRG